MWVGGHVVEQEQTWAEIIQSFEEATGIEVEYRLIGFDVYYDTLVTAFSAGQGPDMTFADLGGWVPTFAAQGWIEPLEDRLAASDITEQIWPNLWPTVTYNGVRYGLPWYTDCRVLMYNKIMFEEAGLDPDKPPVTWDELLEYAKILTDPRQMKYGYSVRQTVEVATLVHDVPLWCRRANSQKTTPKQHLTRRKAWPLSSSTLSSLPYTKYLLPQPRLTAKTTSAA